VVVVGNERKQRALELFAPLGPTYDRYAALLSFGQDPLWRSFLVSRVGAKPGDTVLDVATGTGAVAIELARRYGCSVVGIDQSAEMLDAGRARVARAGLDHLVRLELGTAEQLPLETRFDALTFTYLLRYVDDPARTLAGLVQAVRPGGAICGLDFYIPRGDATRPLWNFYVDHGLPMLGRAIAPGWRAVGEFLGPSIRGFYDRFPLPRLVELWREAGAIDVRHRLLSLGGGVVIWGRRGG
jgi:demethylmenaquinone methyltransferase/2-methoxy-6-polyprenyl-1,4-benzoquinol methylase